MSDRSLIRFGGLAGILLALSSWLAVVVYYALVPAAQRLPIADAGVYLASLAQSSTGSQLFNGLYALIAFWSFAGTVAVYYRLRQHGEAWALFATLIGSMTAILTIVGSLQQLANLRYLAALSSTLPDFAAAALAAPAPLNPVNIVSAGLVAPWFLVISLLMLKADFPRLLAYLGLIAFADLTVGFLAALFGLAPLAILAALVAGAVGGPVFWLWLGFILRRQPA
ncbi:MAG: hypothetical protein K1X65_04870 [Caldilineales bacterium]|nr:hypothetical protein [Caldilineales bacterium]MCW5858108.1 hypothetical protein [Caldilineales bacterium]